MSTYDLLDIFNRLKTRNDDLEKRLKTAEQSRDSTLAENAKLNKLDVAVRDGAALSKTVSGKITEVNALVGRLL